MKCKECNTEMSMVMQERSWGDSINWCPNCGTSNYFERGSDDIKWFISKQLNKWIPVEERLPDEHGTYLVYGESFGYNIDRFTGHWSLEFPVKEEEITHWMPMPASPKGELK